jgi:DNA-binding transcriptional MerR regulator
MSPISGPKLDGGLQYVFRKADIERVDLNSLLSSSKGERISRLNERKLIHIQQAADLLNIDQGDVLDLVERGILSPHRHLPARTHKANGPFFSTYTIEKYKGRTVDYGELVSSKVAAKMLGVSVSTLNDRYVPKKLLQVVLGGGQPRKRYFRLADVKLLIEDRKNLKKYCATTTEAASICDVSAECIHEWVTAGLLQPIQGARADGLGHNLYSRSDIEKLKAERAAFKARCAKEGKTMRYGRSHNNLCLAQ